MVVNMAKTDSQSISNQWPPKHIYYDTFSNNIIGTNILAGDDITTHDSNVVFVEENKSMLSCPNVSMQKVSNYVSHAGKKGNSSKQSRTRKIDSLAMEEVDKTMDQAAKSLNVGRSTLKRFCRDLNMPSWPLPKLHNKNTIHNTDLKPSEKAQEKQNLQQHSNKGFRLSFVVLLIVRVKRWSCLSKSHGLSGKWWSCGRHNYLPSRSNFIYLTAILIVWLRRWRNKISKRNAKPKYTMNIMNNSYSRVEESSLVHAFPKNTVARISDTKMVIVKATYKDDMIKFQFPISSGLMELKNEVAQRIKLEKQRLCLKYKDDDNDLISLASNDDLNFLFGFTANNNTIRLIVDDDYF